MIFCPLKKRNVMVCFFFFFFLIINIAKSYLLFCLLESPVTMATSILCDLRILTFWFHVPQPYFISLPRWKISIHICPKSGIDWLQSRENPDTWAKRQKGLQAHQWRLMYRQAHSREMPEKANYASISLVKLN